MSLSRLKTPLDQILKTPCYKADLGALDISGGIIRSSGLALSEIRNLSPLLVIRSGRPRSTSRAIRITRRTFSGFLTAPSAGKHLRHSSPELTALGFSDRFTIPTSTRPTRDSWGSRRRQRTRISSTTRQTSHAGLRRSGSTLAGRSTTASRSEPEGGYTRTLSQRETRGSCTSPGAGRS